MNTIVDKFLNYISILKLKFKENIYCNRLRYVYERNSSDTLVIIFSAFSPKPRYNYVRTLKNFNKISRLYILDDFGVKGSYYWYEGGKKLPLELTKGLIESIVKERCYKNIITLGTSKGGTCAIYYGLMFNAKHIYAGACQYYVGNYLDTKSNKVILEAMMGCEVSKENVERLNRIMPEQLQNYSGSNSMIHLLYSKDEHTYREHIVHLINDLDKNHISYDEKVESFKNHNDVGKYFISYIKHELDKLNY